ncbi:AMP-binding protein (plasmid) [Tistrella mobilis]|uniref:class I adenylate-forming enzyme family protein n=1 Tax=Tistrella mobilis TaxID=171437 RepID=UPI00355660C1
MNISELLAQSARTFHDRPAVCLGDATVLTYAGLRDRGAALAAGLRARGVPRGGRVVIYMGNRPEYFEMLFGIWAAGCVAVPVNAKLHPAEVDYVLSNSGAGLLFTDKAGDMAGFAGTVAVDGPAYADMLAGTEALMPAFAPVRVAAEDPAWIFYTSGTTGRPKGAVLSHRNLWAMTASFLADIGPVTEGSAALHPAPLSHAAGLFALPFVRRGAANVVPESGGFDPDELVALLHRFPRSSFFAAPTMLNRFIACPALDTRAIAGLDLIFCGGAPIYVEDLRQALGLLGSRIWIGYGQGEVPCTISYLPPHVLGPDTPESWLGSVGIARTGVTVRVVDDAGADCAPDMPGEVIVSGDVVMTGYWQNPEATASALRDGWLHTGDIGSLDAHGVLTLKDRSKDVIISGGSNIYPREVEEVLLRYPGVSEANVTGRPHADWGEEVVAFVVAEDGVTAEALDRFCLDHIARFKRPKSYRFVPSLPKSSYGKILKTELRRMLVESEPAPKTF